MNDLDSILKAATAEVEERYFRLQIHGGPSVFRERVYCYELYHQMRKLWSTQGKYILNGEVDKQAHPLFKKLKAARSKPDLLVHTPGNSDGNHAIIEVKHSLSTHGIAKDLRTLNLFLREVNYQRAIYLIYGDQATTIGIKEIEAEAYKISELGPIEIWLHPNVGVSAAHHTTLYRTSAPLNPDRLFKGHLYTNHVQRDT